MNQVFSSWSGGKDCCLACYRSIASGLKVRYLANTVTEDGRRSCSHGLRADILQVQSQAIGIPLVQPRTTRETYEAEFKNMLRRFKQEGIEGGVFGDIDFNEHRVWIDRVCQEASIIPHLPLWGESQDKILRDFIDLGFKAIVIAAKTDFFGDEVLGRQIDNSFIEQLGKLKETKGITPCGEAGEYHSLVIDGPLFQKRLEIVEAQKVSREGHWFWEILSAELRGK